MSIQVGFSHANGFWSILSNLIMRATGRTYSHCWLLLRGEHGIMGTDVVLTEDENGGLHFAPWIGYQTGKTIVKIMSSPFDLTPGVKALLNVLGTGYDVTGLIGESWVELWKRWFHRKVNDPFRVSSKMWCSEAVMLALEEVKQFALPPGYWVNCDPGDVDDVLTRVGGKVSVP
jgi:hypothetical protein